MYHVYFPQQVIDLQQELQYHPELLAILAVQTNPDPMVRIAEIAAYCKIVLDGYYDESAVLQICEDCTKFLRNRRILYVSTTSH